MPCNTANLRHDSCKSYRYDYGDESCGKKYL